MSASLFQCKEHQAPCQHIRNYPRATADTQESILYLSIKQYTPLNNLKPRVGDITIVAAHSNGYTKELYEPLWDDLLRQSNKTDSFRIRSIWIADVSNSGASGIVNESNLGNDHSWFDHSRDLLHMINYFRTEMPRPLIGMGHSMGGTSIVNLAVMHPRLFTSVVLVDPIIIPAPSKGGRNLIPTYSIIRKQDTWPSREAAESYHRRNKLYQSWDPRVLDRFLQFGIRNSPSLSPSNPHSVTLTTSKYQEAFNHVRAAHPSRDHPFTNIPPPRKTHPDVFRDRPFEVPFYRPEAYLAFTQIPSLLPTVLYISPTASLVTTPDARDACIRNIGTGLGGSGGVEEGAVKEVVIPRSGHFVPFEQPTVLAEVVAEWIAERLKSWRKEEEEEKQKWELVKAENKRRVGEDWMFWMEQFAGKKGQERGAARPKSML